jgi:hypothetical protein
MEAVGSRSSPTSQERRKLMYGKYEPVVVIVVMMMMSVWVGVSARLVVVKWNDFLFK